MGIYKDAVTEIIQFEMENYSENQEYIYELIETE